MKKVCYTAVTGCYDKVADPIVVTPGFDYICFTDHPFSSNIWKCLPIPSELQWLSNVKKQRVLKICPHRFLKEYDLSVWIDGNISVVGRLDEFVQQYDFKDGTFFSRVHPSRNCIYDEAEACMRYKKDSASIIEKQIKRYREEGYPAKAGMVETCILLRLHNESECKMIDDAWAVELLNESHRDQLSFNYVCWKNNFLPCHLVHELKVNGSKYFRIRRHAK